MNWPVIIIVAIAVLALLIFLVKRNMKDEKDFENQIKNDYHKTKDAEGDTDTATITK